MRHRLDADGTYLLYSPGEDGQDHGGNSKTKNSSNSFTEGLDIVWPQPATAKEIEEFEKKQTH